MAKRGKDRGQRDWIEGLELGIAGVSPEGKIRYANSRFSEILGISPKLKLRGRKLTDYIAPSSAQDFLSALRASWNGKVTGEIQVLLGNQFRIVGATFDRIHDHQHTIRIVISELTQAVETTHALQKYEASVQSLSARILQLQDEERRRIARELHDTSGQDMAVLLISLSQLTSKLAQNGASEALQQTLNDAVATARKVEDQIRSLSYVLHPPLLDELGLIAALRWYAEGFQKRSGISVEILAPENAPRLTSERETALFRVIQECLSNILRHSGSDRAKIRFSSAGDIAELSIRDYGKGIPASKLLEAEEGHSLGVGIAGMRERLQQLGGNLEISSNQHGSMVVARVPLEQQRVAVQDPSLPYATERNATATAAKRILIADDHEVTRRGIRSLLENESDLQVCGEAEDGIQAAHKVAELHPDLVILDLTMPRAGGFSAIKRIRATSHAPKILIFSTHTYAHLAATLRLAGCDGFVSKGKASEDLVRGIRSVLAGHKFFISEAPLQLSHH